MSENNLGAKSKEALRHIRNWIMNFGKFPSVRDLMNAMGYKSPRSATLLLEELLENGFLERKDDNSFRMSKDLSSETITHTVLIPLVGNVSCGAPLLADENIEAMIPVSTTLAKRGSRYFFLRATGDSMNEAGINSGDLIMVKQQSFAENGQNVVALIDDAATVKEFQVRGDVVALLPRSTNPKHKPIIIESNFLIQGVVVTTIPNINI